MNWPPFTKASSLFSPSRRLPLAYPFRAMHDNQIPMDLLEALFLSVIMHAVDHVLADRIMWGLNFKLDFDWERPSTL